MIGDYNKCELGDFVYVHDKRPSFSWQNDMYMIVKKQNFPRVYAIRVDIITLGNINEHGFLSPASINIEFDVNTLIPKKDIFNKINNPDYSY